MFKKSISENNYQYYKYVYFPIQHKNKLSLLRNVDYVKKIKDQKSISPGILKHDLDIMLTSGKFAKGGVSFYINIQFKIRNNLIFCFQLKYLIF